MIENVCRLLFYPILHPIFDPTNKFLGWFDRWPMVATVCAVGFFVGTMVWVGVILPKAYVNRGRPSNALWTDLRLWTVLSMLPHVFVYIYFRGIWQ